MGTPFLVLIVKTVTDKVLRASWWLSWLSSYHVSLMCWFHVCSVTFVSCQHTQAHFCFTLVDHCKTHTQKNIKAINNLKKWFLCAKVKSVFYLNLIVSPLLQDLNSN